MGERSTWTIEFKFIACGVWGILLIKNRFHHPALPAGRRVDSLRSSISAPFLDGFTNLRLEGVV
jgi:hypothetical protein